MSMVDPMFMMTFPGTFGFGKDPSTLMVSRSHDIIFIGAQQSGQSPVGIGANEDMSHSYSKSQSYVCIRDPIQRADRIGICTHPKRLVSVLIKNCVSVAMSLPHTLQTLPWKVNLSIFFSPSYRLRPFGKDIFHQGNSWVVVPCVSGSPLQPMRCLRHTTVESG